MVGWWQCTDLSDKQQCRRCHRGPAVSFPIPSFHYGLTSSDKINRELQSKLKHSNKITPEVLQVCVCVCKGGCSSALRKKQRFKVKVSSGQKAKYQGCNDIKNSRYDNALVSSPWYSISWVISIYLSIYLSIYINIYIDKSRLRKIPLINILFLIVVFH